MNGERLLLPVLHRTGLYRAAGRINRSKVVIVMYHGFTALASHPGIENHEQKHVFVGTLEKHLEYLKAHYNVMPLADVVRLISAGAPLPDRAAVITVDDGYRATYTVAFPVMRRLGLPAAVFLATDFVENRRFLWTDRVEYAVNHAATDFLDVQLGDTRLRLPVAGRQAKAEADKRLRSAMKALTQEMRERSTDAVENAAGARIGDGKGSSELYEPLSWGEAAEMVGSGLVAIGGHTHTHAILSRCDPARISHELSVSKEIIETRLRVPCDLFCYPNGRRGDFNQATRAAVKLHGYSCALTTVYGMNGQGSDRYELRRYNLGKPMTAGELEVRLSGAIDLGTAIARALRPGAGRARTRRC